MSDIPLDTNVIIRYLVEDPEQIDDKFKGVYTFFKRIEKGDLSTHLPELVAFQAYFVLTSFYEVPRKEAAEKLRRVVQLRGIQMAEKSVVIACLERLEKKNLDLVDSYLLSWSEAKGVDLIYSFDQDLARNGLELLPVK